MRKMKMLFVVLVVLGGFGGCNSGNDPKKDASESTQQKVLTIGVIIPLTGDYAKIGTDIQKAIEVAHKDAVKKGLLQEGQIKVIFEDNKLDASNTVSAYNKLRSTEDIQAVITVTSKCILALKPLANQERVLLLNASAISTEIEDAADYCFSFIPNAKAEAAYLSDYLLNERNVKTLAIVYRDDQSGQSFNDCFSTKYNKDGGKIAETVAHPANMLDFKTIIAKLKSNKSINGIFMASLGIETANFMKQSRGLNFNLPVYTYESINQPKVIEIADKTIDNIEFVSPKFNPADSAYILFKQSIKDNYNSDEINFYMVSHYNAFMTLAKLYNQGFTDGEEFKTHISRLGKVEFLGPAITIDSNGNATTAMEIYGFKNKQIFTVN